MTNDERRAVALYAILTRDAGDFLDMIREPETTDEALAMLHEMLTFEQDKQDEDAREWNRLGAPIVAREIERRKREKEEPR